VCVFFAMLRSDLNDSMQHPGGVLLAAGLDGGNSLISIPLLGMEMQQIWPVSPKPPSPALVKFKPACYP